MGLDIVFHIKNLEFDNATVADGDSNWPTKNGESLHFKGGNTLSIDSESTLLFSQTVANHFSANVRDGKLDVESHTETKGSLDPTRIGELMPPTSYHKFLSFSIGSVCPEDCATLCASLLAHSNHQTGLETSDIVRLKDQIDNATSTPTSDLQVKESSHGVKDLAIEETSTKQIDMVESATEHSVPLQIISQDTDFEQKDPKQDEVLQPGSQDISSAKDEREDTETSNIRTESDSIFPEDPMLVSYETDVAKMAEEAIPDMNQQ